MVDEESYCWCIQHHGKKYYLCKEVTYKIIDKSYLQYPACDIGILPSNLSPIYRIINTWTFSARDKFLPRSPVQLGRASGPYWYGIIYSRINQEKYNPSLMKLNNTDDYWPLILVTSSLLYCYKKIHLANISQRSMLSFLDRDTCANKQSIA